MVAVFSLTWPREDIALLTLDVPNSETNILSLATLEELDDHLQLLSEQDGVAGLIIRSGKSGNFASGFGVQELLPLVEAPEEALHYFRRGQQILSQLSKQPFVTVAAIEGLCLGSGAEMAAWCDRRLFAENPKTKIGFPDVKLGLLPCCGGTVRAPRVVGFTGALEMICTGKLLDAQTAMQMGWATATVRADQLLDAAVDLMREEQRTRSYATDSERLSQPLELPSERCIATPPTEDIPAGTEQHYPASAAILELMTISCGLPQEEALQCETRIITKLFGSPVNRALLNVFGLIDRANLKHDRNRAPIQPR